MELYENDPSRIAEYGSEADRNVRCEKLTAREYGWKNAWLWNLATLGKVKVYAVYDGEKLRTVNVETVRYHSTPSRYSAPAKRKPEIKAPKRKR